MFRHDATNLSKYPWIQVCLKEFFMLWLCPILFVTSKSFQAAMANEKIAEQWRIMRRAKACATAFLLAWQRSKLKVLMIKHMWAVWPHIERVFFSAADLGTIRPIQKISQQQSQKISYSGPWFVRWPWNSIVAIAHQNGVLDGVFGHEGDGIV
jgi:hypothetical protein